jgi:hypothetical protein
VRGLCFPAVKISIIPGPDAQGDEETLDRLLSFEQTLSVDAFDNGRLLDVFAEVKFFCRFFDKIILMQRGCHMHGSARPKHEEHRGSSETILRRQPQV